MLEINENNIARAIIKVAIARENKYYSYGIRYLDNKIKQYKDNKGIMINLINFRKSFMKWWYKRERNDL